MTGAGRFLIMVPAIAGLGWLGTDAVRAGDAANVAYDSAQAMDAWRAAPEGPASQAIDRLQRDLERAVTEAPRDPAVQELLGALAMRSTDRVEGTRQALARFTRAAELRPSSPYPWSNIVELEYRRGGTGPVFEAALRNAAALGPSEPEVQRTVADFGLAAWDEVAPDTRHAIEAAVTGAMRRSAPETLRIAAKRDRLAIACRHLVDSPRQVDSWWHRLCQEREATS